MTQQHSLGMFVLVVLATFAATTISYGQGVQSARNPAQGPSKSQAGGPVTMTECEGTNNCATWTFLGAQGNGQWPSGAVANLSVERFDADTVVIRRADSTGSSVGLRAVYKGLATVIVLEENSPHPGRGTGTVCPATGTRRLERLPKAFQA